MKLSDFPQLLRWHFGDTEAFKASLLQALAKYKAAPVQTERIRQRIRVYEGMVEMCDPNTAHQTGQLELTF